MTPDNLSCRTENGRSAVADLLISAAPPTPAVCWVANLDQSMLAYHRQSYSALARLRIGMRTQLAMPDPHGHLAMCVWRYYVPLTFEILKHEYLIYEKCNLVFRYKIHYKNMSSDWAKNLGMCLWRYYVPLIFEILKHEYLILISRFQIFRENVQKNLQIFKNQSSDVSK